MKKVLFFLILLFTLNIVAQAQCSICTKTAAQLGEKPARGLNAGIVYLAAIPILMAFFIGFRWWRKNRLVEEA